MARQTQDSMLLVGVIAGGITLAAFLVLLVLFEFTFSPALFLSLLVGLVAAIVLYRGFHDKAELPSATQRATEEAKEKVAAMANAPSAAHATGIAGAASGDLVQPPAAPVDPAPAEAATEASPAPAEAPAATSPAPAELPAAASPAPGTVGTAPAKLEAAREGGADDLKRIKGVGPKLEAMLHRMGFFHYDQIAVWTASEVAWVDDNLEGFKGRVSRDDWVAQAKILAAGGETEFSKRQDG